MRHASAHPSNRCPVDALCEFGVGPFFHFLIYSDNFRSWWSDDMVVHDTIRRECQSTGILADGDTPVVAYDNHLGVRHFHPKICTRNTYINNNRFELKLSASNENSNIPRHCSIGGLNFLMEMILICCWNDANRRLRLMQSLNARNPTFFSIGYR